MGNPTSTRSPQRLQRALAAFVWQEFGAPAAAIIGFAEILLEDARRHGLDDLLPDLDRIRVAGLQLQTLLAQLIDLATPDRSAIRDDFAAFRAKLRHDLRTPLTAVKGYGEMILEEARVAGRETMTADVTKLLGAADELLKQIDGLSDFAIDVSDPPRESSALADVASRDLVSQVIQSIQPVAGSAQDAAHRDLSSRILVVDDTAANRDLLSRWLTRDSHTVHTVENGRSALEWLANTDVDLVLLDLMMPDMNGFEVLCRLKADARARYIPVIMISALDEVDSIVRCIEAGAEDYLSKPFNQIILRARINASLDRKRFRDRERAFTNQLRSEKEKTEALLLNILPKTIVDRMRRGELVIADRFDEVTVLFSDLVGFTNLASRLSPTRTINLLNELFTSFDRLATEFGLEKIKTIGDAYMAAGGLPESRPDHAVAVAEMASKMVEVVTETGVTAGEPLEVRIGMHSGDVVAGIIGRHKFIYDVWGDTVNTASRLESCGLPGRIHISESTYRRVSHAFHCEMRGAVNVKGKGPMVTYFLGERYRSA
jgi:class 3 adenylate cyclase/signal transduction histidine kinase